MGGAVTSRAPGPLLRRTGRELLRRLGIVAVFAVCGGPAGGLAVAAAGTLAGLLASPFGGRGGEDLMQLVAAIPDVLVLVTLFGAVLGWPCALAAGLIYASLPGPAQRIALAPVVGALACVVVFAVAGRSAWAPAMDWPGFLLLFIAPGAVAAAVCAVIVRRAGLDALGARRR